jgi:ATP-dependent Clp protease ATP-binding subunit ClpA
MNLDKFTERSRGFMQAAQTIATRESHQRLAPEHLLKALMDDDQGLAANLITRGGGDAAAVRMAVDLAVSKIAKVSGDASQWAIVLCLSSVCLWRSRWSNRRRKMRLTQVRSRLKG